MKIRPSILEIFTTGLTSSDDGAITGDDVTGYYRRPWIMNGFIEDNYLPTSPL
jgi:hypothetical protein